MSDVAIQPALPAPVAADAVQPSTWENIKNGIVEGAQWFGRQVVAFFKAIADYAVKAWEWAKPKFIDAKDWIVDKTGQAKDWVVAHKQETIIASVAFAIGIVLTAIIHAACCTTKGADAASKKKPDAADAKAPTDAPKTDGKKEEKKVTVVVE